eukprot:scaffold84269_cov64-Phaeocystis_antarctica.AAC.1
MSRSRSDAPPLRPPPLPCPPVPPPLSAPSPRAAPHPARSSPWPLPKRWVPSVPRRCIPNLGYWRATIGQPPAN